MVAATLPPRKRFTRDEVYRMLDAGIFDGQRFELLDGDLIDKMGQSPRHSASIRRINSVLAAWFPVASILIQAPIDVGPADHARNEPEPDAAVLAEPKPDYAERHPRGDELLVVIEAADTSLRTDLTFKRDLYARAGVPEYWVLDLNDRQITVHRDLDAGEYRNIRTFTESENIGLAGHPETPVSALLP